MSISAAEGVVLELWLVEFELLLVALLLSGNHSIPHPGKNGKTANNATMQVIDFETRMTMLP